MKWLFSRLCVVDDAPEMMSLPYFEQLRKPLVTHCHGLRSIGHTLVAIGPLELSGWSVNFTFHDVAPKLLGLDPPADAEICSQPGTVMRGYTTGTAVGRLNVSTSNLTALPMFRLKSV